LLREVSVDNKKRGANPEFLDLTDSGRAVVEDLGYDSSTVGRGGVEHRYWQHRIKEYYEEQGYEATIEYPVSEGEIDVYAESGDRNVAVEVARGPEHEVENIEKCVKAGVDKIQVVYLDGSVKDTVRSATEQEFGEIPGIIEFVSASTFS
jgi:hypothetical protein